MTEEFRTLRDDEIEIILNSPAMVAVLIAGADDDIDKDEIKSGIAFSEKKKLEEGEELAEYFSEVSTHFENVQNNYINDLPENLELRQNAITSYLRQLNGILPKIEEEISMKIYGFLLEMAKEVAQASGGVMGFNKTSKDEAAFTGLDMIKDPSENQY